MTSIGVRVTVFKMAPTLLATKVEKYFDCWKMSFLSIHSLDLETRLEIVS